MDGGPDERIAMAGKVPLPAKMLEVIASKRTQKPVAIEAVAKVPADDFVAEVEVGRLVRGHACTRAFRASEGFLGTAALAGLVRAGDHRARNDG